MEPMIRLEGLGKTFSLGGEKSSDAKGPEGKGPETKGVEVLRSIDLDIDAGEFVALKGTSGSGKSTLLHILGLLDRPTSGRYLLEGQDVSLLDDDRQSDIRNGRIGFVFQSFYLVPYASALENVLLPGKYSRESQTVLRSRAEELLERVGLADRMSFKPSRLSGGQQQRVAMARALINEPDLILADEPTGQLDSKTSAELMDLFTSVHDLGKTIVLVTHEDATASVAQRIIELHDGHVVGQQD